MKVERHPWITRAMARAAPPGTVFLFGDNLTQRGFGGQARALRGEPNAIGIPTKRAPGMLPGDFFTDAEYESNCRAIDAAFARIPIDATVVIPEKGIGTGLAQLSWRAPRTAVYLDNRLRALGQQGA